MKNINSNEFARNVLTLMTGTVLAQAIPIAIIPILTRIFSPEDFGVLALYGAIVSVMSAIATGRYEIAVMLPKEDADAKVLLQISAIIAFVISLLLFIPIIFWNKNIAALLGNLAIAPWLYLIPASVFLTGLYQALTYWHNRQKKFNNTAVSKINQSLFQGISQTGFGFIKLSSGLIIGQFVGIFSSFAYLFIKDKSYNAIFLKNSKEKIVCQLKKYQKFPKYSVFGGLCDAAAVHMPIFILTKFYSGSVTGMFSLTFRVLSMPTTIISSAIGQVLFQKVVQISHTDPNRLAQYIIKIFILLFLMYLPVVPILYIFGDHIFAFVFGEEWRQAGIYASYLVVAVAVRFAISPLSAVLGLEKNIKKGVFWQFLYICTVTPTLYLFSSFEIEQFIIAFVIHEVVLYTIYLILIIQGSKEVKQI